MEPTGQSDLVEIARRNGDFKRNYGLLLGAFLYLRSLSAVCGGSFSWAGLLIAVLSAVLVWWFKLGWRSP